MQYVTPRDRGVTGFSTETVSPAKTASYDIDDRKIKKNITIDRSEK